MGEGFYVCPLEEQEAVLTDEVNFLVPKCVHFSKEAEIPSF